MKDALAGVIAVGALAVLILAALIGLGIADTWTPDNTQDLVTAVTVTCAGGLIVFATIFGVFIGLAFYRRMSAPDGRSRAQSIDAAPTDWQQLPAGGPWRPYTEPTRPALPAPSVVGEWRDSGVVTYLPAFDDYTR